MSRKSSSTHYGTVAVTIHWLTAILIVVLLGSGFNAGGSEDSVAKVFFLRFHVPIGLTILLLTIARICWWVFADKKPEPVAMPVWQDRMSRVVHVVLYLAIIGLSTSGVGMMILSGAGPYIFGIEDPSLLPNFWDYIPRTPHGIVGRVLVVLIILHAGAALYHHFVVRDGLLSRIWFAKHRKGEEA